MQAGVAVGDAENLGRCPEHGVVEPMTGIEPAFSAWEADVLPLNYIGVWDSDLRIWDSIARRVTCRCHTQCCKESAAARRASSCE